MVRVPTTPGRSVQFSPADPRPLRYAESRNLVGPAVENAGRAMGEAAEVWQRVEERYDRADLLTGDNAHAEYLADRKQEFSGLRGDAPAKQLDEYLRGVEQHSKQLLNGARSERSRTMLKRVLNDRNLIARDAFTSHADEQTFQFEDAGLLAGRNIAARDAIAAPDDEGFGVAVGVGLLRIEERANLKGAGDEVRTLARQEFLDEVHGGRIDALFAAPDPDINAIGRYLDRFGGQITPSLKNETLARLQAPLQARVSRSDADLVMGFQPQAQDGVPSAPMLALPTGPQGEVGNVLNQAGYSPAVVAGFLGNFDIEGGYHGALGDGGTASGIAQWRHERRDNFRRRFGKDPHEATFAEQAQFVVWEMANPERAGMSKATRDRILAAGSAGEAAALIDQHYERSSGQHRTQRKAAAEKYGGAGYESGPRQWDRAQVYANLEAVAERDGWNPERMERARSELDRRINRDEGLLSEQRQDADEQVTALVQSMGENFKSIEQIPAALRNNLSPSDLIAWENLARQNSQPAAAAANGPRAMELNLMRFYEPERFKTLNLGHFAGDMTPAEMETLMVTQAKMRTDGGKPSSWSPRSGIVTALNYGKKLNQLELDGADEAAILQIMEAEARAVHAANGGKPLTDNDYQALFRSATRNVQTTKSFLGFETGRGERARYRLDLGTMPARTRDRLERRLKEAGLAVTDEALLRLYRLEQ